MLLLLNNLVRVKHTEFSAEISSNPIKLDELFILFLVESQKDVLCTLRLVRPVLSMAPSLVIFEEALRNEDILKLLGSTVSQIADKVRLPMVLFKIIEVAIVNELQMLAIYIANFTFHVSTHLQMNFECFQVVESPIAKFTQRVIQHDFSCLAELPFPQMSLQLIIIVEGLLGSDAFSIVKTDLTG